MEDSPLNYAFVVANLCGEFKRTISYDKTKLKKLGNFYITTWLNFAGLVTYGSASCMSLYRTCFWFINKTPDIKDIIYFICFPSIVNRCM